MPFFQRGSRRRAEAQRSSATISINGRRTTSYPETLVNFSAFYLTYLLLLGSTVLIFLFGWRAPTVSVQTFDVQPQPNVIFAWNADPSATILPETSAVGQNGGGSATCTPDRWSRSSQMQYACTSIASDGLAKLVFSVFSATPSPFTQRYLKYSDISVPSYYMTYYTHIPSTTAAQGAAVTTTGFAGSATGSSSTPISASPTPAQSIAPASVMATSTPGPVQRRQATSAISATSTPNASPSGTDPLNPSSTASLPMITIMYGGMSRSALAAGTVVSQFPTPSATATSIAVQSATFKTGFLVFFTLIAVFPLLSTTLTLILVSYNLKVASRKVWPSELSADQDASQLQLQLFNDKTPRPAQLRPLGQQMQQVAMPTLPGSAQLRIYNQFMDRTTSASGNQPQPAPRRNRNARGRRASTIVGGGAAQPDDVSVITAPPTYEQSHAAARLNAGSLTATQEESNPPAYHDQASLAQAGTTSATQRRDRRRNEDEIEVATDSDSDDDSAYAAPNGLDLRFLDDASPSRQATFSNRYRNARSAVERSPPKERTDGTRLPLRLAWMSLPTYAVVFWWDLIVYFVAGVPEIVAFSLALDSFVDLIRFVNLGGCLGEPADKDSVYDLQRALCGPRKFLSAYPQAYSNATPATSIMLFGRDPMILVIGLAVLMISNFAWIVVLCRKSALAERDGMEPADKNSGPLRTGKTSWGYVTAFNKVGLHGRGYHLDVEDRSNGRRR